MYFFSFTSDFFLAELIVEDKFDFCRCLRGFETQDRRMKNRGTTTRRRWLEDDRGGVIINEIMKYARP